MLDIERSQEDPIEKQKEEMKSKIESMTPEQLARMRELINNGKNSESLESIRSNSSSVTAGNTSELCLTEKSSSKKVTRTLCENGSSGIQLPSWDYFGPTLFIIITISVEKSVKKLTIPKAVTLRNPLGFSFLELFSETIFSILIHCLICNCC